jgi:hypothetical protein
MFPEVLIMIQQVNLSLVKQIVELMSALVFKIVSMNLNFCSYLSLDRNHLNMAVYS